MIHDEQLTSTPTETEKYTQQPLLTQAAVEKKENASAACKSFLAMVTLADPCVFDH